MATDGVARVAERYGTEVAKAVGFKGANLMRLYLLAALSLAPIGCATSGPAIDAPRLSEIRKGETTVVDVVSRFGRPSILSKNMDGTQTAAYMYAKEGAGATAFVPLMIALAGKADADVDSVIFYFDGKGVLSDYRTTQARARIPAAADAETTTQPPANTPTQITTQSPTDKPTQARKKSSGSDNPWTIQLYPSGYRENR